MLQVSRAKFIIKYSAESQNSKKCLGCRQDNLQLHYIDSEIIFGQKQTFNFHLVKATFLFSPDKNTCNNLA